MGQVPFTGGPGAHFAGSEVLTVGKSGAHHRGLQVPIKGGLVPITFGSGAHCREVRCPLSQALPGRIACRAPRPPPPSAS